MTKNSKSVATPNKPPYNNNIDFLEFKSLTENFIKKHELIESACANRAKSIPNENETF
jgi:hypothetical protein